MFQAGLEGVYLVERGDRGGWSGQKRLSSADEDRTWTPMRDRPEEPTVQKWRNNQKRAVFEVRVGDIPRSLSEKQCSKRYASLVECKNANYSTTKSSLL